MQTTELTTVQSVDLMQDKSVSFKLYENNKPKYVSKARF
jgi:hypothetical protein